MSTTIKVLQALERARFHRTTDQTLSASTWTRMGFDTTVLNRGSGIVLTAATYVTLTNAGDYEIHYGGGWDPIAGTPGRIMRLSTGVTATDSAKMAGSRAEFNTLDVMNMHGYWDGSLAAGTTLGVDFWSDSVNSYPNGSASVPWYLSIKRIG